MNTRFIDRRRLARLRGWARFYGRRQGWLNERMTPRKLREMTIAGIDFLERRENVRAFPLVLKIDISPACQLACPACVHATPRGDGGRLDLQLFSGPQRMALADYRRIIDEVAGHSLAVSLYYLGDPYAHPQADEFCRVAFDAGLNVHVSSNLSYRWSDQRIAEVVHSGVTHLTACVDGATQDVYELNRVGGRLPWVLSNLERLATYKRREGLKYPRLEVQFVQYPHNRSQREEVRQMVAGVGIRRFAVENGSPGNWAERPPPEEGHFSGRQGELIPRCHMPWSSMTIRYDGNAIPCCLHRIGEQYTAQPPRHLLGNVLESSVWSVWNGSTYRAIRRISSDPARAESMGELQSSFCNGCTRVTRRAPS